MRFCRNKISLTFLTLFIHKITEEVKSFWMMNCIFDGSKKCVVCVPAKEFYSPVLSSLTGLESTKVVKNFGEFSAISQKTGVDLESDSSSRWSEEFRQLKRIKLDEIKDITDIDSGLVLRTFAQSAAKPAIENVKESKSQALGITSGRSHETVLYSYLRSPRYREAMRPPPITIPALSEEDL
jgi:hypothetical protein